MIKKELFEFERNRAEAKVESQREMQMRVQTEPRSIRKDAQKSRNTIPSTMPYTLNSGSAQKQQLEVMAAMNSLQTVATVQQ